MYTATTIVKYQDLRDRVRSKLAIVGKRLYDKNGNSLFDKVTASSIEDSVLESYVRQAANDTIAQLAGYIVSVSRVPGDESVTITFHTGQDMNTTLNMNIQDFCVLDATAMFMSSYYPQQAQPFIDAAKSAINNLVVDVFSKPLPTTDTSYSEIKTTVA